MLTVNLNDLRDLPVVQLGPTEIAVVGQKHQNLLSLMAEIRGLYGRIEAELKALSE